MLQGAGSQSSALRETGRIIRSGMRSYDQNLMLRKRGSGGFPVQCHLWRGSLLRLHFVCGNANIAMSGLTGKSFNATMVHIKINVAGRTTAAPINV